MVTEFVIKRSEWLRGEGANNSQLIREKDGKKCCLGIYGLACGITAEEMKFLSEPYQLATIKPALLPKEMYWLVTQDGPMCFNNTLIATELMNTNDVRGIGEYFRERKVAEYFAMKDIIVRFED